MTESEDVAKIVVNWFGFQVTNKKREGEEKMKTLIMAQAVFVLASCSAVAQDTQPAQSKSDSPTGFAFLKQFEGDWLTVSKQPTDDESAQGETATLSSRAIGNHWIVNKHQGEIGGTKFEAMQSIGYDSTKKQFVGTWIDSALSYTWHYKGSLDSTGKKLLLEAEGPDWNDMSKMRNYRDVYEFKSKDEIAGTSQMMNDQGEWKTFMTSTMTRKPENALKTTVAPFLMFVGKSQAAIDFYKTVFPDTKVESLTKWAAGESGKEGEVKVATFVIAGQRIMCSDSPIKHDFDFTPSFSFFVECENEAQLKERFDKLAKGGKVMMPIGNYGFSKMFAWTSDRFGVSWQLNLK